MHHRIDRFRVCCKSWNKKWYQFSNETCSARRGMAFICEYEKTLTNGNTELNALLSVFLFYSKSFTAFHEGRDVILFHHSLTCGRDSKKLASPFWTRSAPYGKWKRSAKVNAYKFFEKKMSREKMRKKDLTHLPTEVRLFGEDLFINIQFSIELFSECRYFGLIWFA